MAHIHNQSRDIWHELICGNALVLVPVHAEKGVHSKAHLWNPVPEEQHLGEQMTGVIWIAHTLGDDDWVIHSVGFDTHVGEAIVQHLLLRLQVDHNISVVRPTSKVLVQIPIVQMQAQTNADPMLHVAMLAHEVAHHTWSHTLQH